MKKLSLVRYLAVPAVATVFASHMVMAKSYEEEDKCYETCYDQHMQSLENCIEMRSWCETICETQSPTGCGESCVDTCFETEDRCDILADEQHEQCAEACSDKYDDDYGY